MNCDDYDPINGRYVNKEHEKLIHEIEVAQQRKDEEEVRRLHMLSVALFQKAVAENHPLAMFYLGVCYRMGSGVPKDLDKSRSLLTKALELGVERAEDFLPDDGQDDLDDGKIGPWNTYKPETFLNDAWMFPNGRDDG